MRPNKGMKQTKPAQAMELRSLSPVFDSYLKVDDDADPRTGLRRSAGGEAAR